MKTPLRCLAGTFVAACMAATFMAEAQSPPATATTSYGYDEAGNRNRQVDSLGRATAWTFDAKRRPTSRTLPDGSTETSSYDVAGNLLGRTTFAGESFFFQYDVVDRITAEVIPPGSGSNAGIAAAGVTYGYTASDMLRSRRESGPTTLDGLQTYSYDAAGRLLEATSPIGRITYTPDARGNVLERSVVGAGTVKYEYDAANRLVKVTTPEGRQTRYGYDGSGRVATIDRDLLAVEGQPQWVHTGITYDAAGRIVLIGNVRRIGGAASFLAGQSIRRNPGGTIVSIATDRGDGSFSTAGSMRARTDIVQSFEYDGLARLTRERREHDRGVTDTRYTYDIVGNRSTMTVTTGAGTELTEYQYDAADRLTQEATQLHTGATRSVSYTWDGNGNIASKTEPGRVTLYRFDPRNRLIDIRQGLDLAAAGGAIPLASYAYDADGNLVRTTGEAQRRFLVDSNYELPQLVREATGADAIDYARGLSLIRQKRTGAAGTEELYPLYGHLGTSLGAVDERGEVVERVGTDAFGNLDRPKGLKQAHLYNGEYWDQDAQLLYLRARWYDPRIGRFISADPFEGSQRDPRSLNRYAYAHGDPVHVVDPTGTFGFVSVSVGGLAQASFRGFSVGSAGSFVAKTGAEIAFEMATGIPVITSPRSLIGAVRSGANVTGSLATKFWLNMFKGGVDFEKEAIKFLSKLGYTKNTKHFANGELSSAKSGYFIPDVYVKGDKLLDFKTSFGALSKEQFQQFIMIANQELGLKVSLVMLKKPTPGEIAIMEKWAKEVSTKTHDKDILFSVIHLLD